MRILIVIPTYNEIENVEAITTAVLAATPSNVEVLVADDNSPDGTGRKVDELIATRPRLHVLHRPGKAGLGMAYVAGFKWGLSHDFDALIEMDADFSHDPKYLAQMLALLETHDAVMGSRWVKGGGTVNWGIGRKILSLGGSFYSRMILGAPVRDFTGGFNAWRKAILEKVDFTSLRSDGYSFQIELKYRAFLAGARMIEFPIVFTDRTVGKSKMSKKIVIEALGKVWSFRLRALRQGHGVLGRLLYSPHKR